MLAMPIWSTLVTRERRFASSAHWQAHPLPVKVSAARGANILDKLIFVVDRDRSASSAARMLDAHMLTPVHMSVEHAA